MENNLDDILVDNPENQNENDGTNTHSKRNVLMGVASALLIGVVGLTLYFVVFKDKEAEVKGLEVTHSELEQFTLPEQEVSIETQKEGLQENAQENTQEAKVDDEFDKLIAELKQVENDQGAESTKAQDVLQPPAVEESTVQITQNNDGLSETIVIGDEIEPNQQGVQSTQMAQSQGMQTQGINQEAKGQDERVQNQNSAKQESVKQEPAKQDLAKQEPVKQNIVAIQDNPNHQQASIAQDKSPQTEASQKVENSPAPQTKTAQPKEQKSKIEASKATTAQAKTTATQAPDSQKIPQGFYLQVGVFSKTPNADFLKKLEGFSYKVQKVNSGGKVVNRYLIGGFKSRAEAQAQIDAITKKIAKPVIVEIR